MTSDFKYFNSVISVMVSNPVEVLIVPQSPRSPYEPNMFSIFLHVKRSLKTVSRFLCKRVAVIRPEETLLACFRLPFRVMLAKKKYSFKDSVVPHTCAAMVAPDRQTLKQRKIVTCEICLFTQIN